MMRSISHFSSDPGESPIKENSEYYEQKDSVKSLKKWAGEQSLPQISEPAVLMITPKPKVLKMLTLTRNHKSVYDNMKRLNTIQGDKKEIKVYILTFFTFALRI